MPHLTAHYDALLANRTADFTVKSRGEVRKGPFPFVAWRRIQAEYRVCAATTATADCDSDSQEREKWGRLVSYAEMTQQTP